VRKESAVNDELTVEVLLCGEYERLLNVCQQSLDDWNGRSEEIRQTHQKGEAAGRELLRLQARFAKSYTVLQRHIERCEECQLAVRVNQTITHISMESLSVEAN
jgi:predicted secreted protein